MTILSILNELAATTKRKEKEAILKREFKNEELKLVLWATYNPDLTYWIAKHPEFSTDDFTHKILLSVGISQLLSGLAERKYTGAQGIEYYRQILFSLSADDAVVLQRIVDRDLRCGLGVPTINKIWAGLIPEYELMLASTEDKKLVYPCYIQEKIDGLRCLITHTSTGDFIARTRNGSVIQIPDFLQVDFKEVIPKSETWDGELVCVDKTGKCLPRKVGNGILNKALRGTISDSELKMVRFIAWDVVDQSQKIPYRERLSHILGSRLHSGECNLVQVIHTSIAHNKADLERIFNGVLEEGCEGIIAKNIESVWQPKRTMDLVKYKAEHTADLVVVGWIEGTGKYEGLMGALTCESSDGLIQVNVGSGFTDKQRQDFTAAKMIDKIVEIVYNARIKSESGTVERLYLPRFKALRLDKSTANSSEEIHE